MFSISIRVFCKKHKGSTTMHKTQEYEAFLVRQDALPEGCSSQIPNGKNEKTLLSTFLKTMRISKNTAWLRKNCPKRGDPGGGQSHFVRLAFWKCVFVCLFRKSHHFSLKRLVICRWHHQISLRILTFSLFVCLKQKHVIFRTKVVLGPKTWSSRRGHKSSCTIVIRICFFTFRPPKFRHSRSRARRLGTGIQPRTRRIVRG